MDITPSLATPDLERIAREKVIIICIGIGIGIAIGYWLASNDDIKTYLYGWKMGSEYQKNKTVIDALNVPITAPPIQSDVADAPSINNDKITE